MNMKYLKSYILNTQYIIHEVTQMNMKPGSILSRKSPYFTKDIAVVFGIVGNISGQTTFSMSKGLACKIASAMIGGDEVIELDELSKSAIAEMGNMIMGHTASNFCKDGMLFDITPPSILEGDKMCFSLERMEIAYIPMLFDDGNILEINVAYNTFESENISEHIISY